MQRIINKILQIFLNQFVIIYINNILLYSEIENKYIKYIKIVLKLLKKIRFKIKLKKSGFYLKKIDFLKYIIILNKIKINKMFI